MHRQEVAMTASVTNFEEIDLEISVASIALSSARSAFTRCPSGENERVVDAAAAEVDRLLDRRLAVAG
jgi:hypothetical protein